MFLKSFTKKIVPADGEWTASVFSFMSTREARKEVFRSLTKILESKDNIDHLLRAATLVINISCNLDKDSLCEMIELSVFPLVISNLRGDSHLDKVSVDRFRVICWLSVVFATENSCEDMLKLLVSQGVIWVVLCMFDEDFPDKKGCLQFNIVALKAVRRLLSVNSNELQSLILLEIQATNGFDRMFLLTLSADEETKLLAEQVKLLSTQLWTRLFNKHI
jgi:hypothetical protein